MTVAGGSASSTKPVDLWSVIRKRWAWIKGVPSFPKLEDMTYIKFLHEMEDDFGVTTQEVLHPKKRRKLNSAQLQVQKVLQLQVSPLQERESKRKRQEELEMAEVRYRHALRKLATAFPQLPSFSPEPVRATERNSDVCFCGRGRLGRWPWMHQDHEMGFCGSFGCSADDSGEIIWWPCGALHQWRTRWVEVSLGRDFEW